MELVASKTGLNKGGRAAEGGEKHERARLFQYTAWMHMEEEGRIELLCL